MTRLEVSHLVLELWVCYLVTGCVAEESHFTSLSFSALIDKITKTST